MVVMSSEIFVAWIICGLCAIYYVLKRFNSRRYEPTLKKGSAPLPPGDMGWPLLGNMLTFLTAFKSSNPESFIASFASRFNRVGLYKAFMFGKPIILVTSPEACNIVMMNDTQFLPGWPKSAVDLIGPRSFVAITFDEHKRLRKLTSAPVIGPEALSKHLTWIEDIIVSALEDWSKMDKVTFKIIASIFVGNDEMAVSEREYTALNMGVRAMAINLPGTAFWKARKARRKLTKNIQPIIDKRKVAHEKLEDKKEDMLDLLLKVKDEHGRFLDDDEIIDLLIMYLNVGHESSGHMTMWIILLLQQHLEIRRKCKEQEWRDEREYIFKMFFGGPKKGDDRDKQEQILRRRPERQKHLLYTELREMKYLHKNFFPRPGMFMPFGLGSRLCPGNELAKMEMCVFVHCILLHYEVHRLTPECKLMYLPHPCPIDDCPVIIRKLKPSQQI